MLKEFQFRQVKLEAGGDPPAALGASDVRIEIS